MRARSPRYAALTAPEPLSASEIQKQVLDPETLLLEYSLGEQRGFLWIVSTSTISSVELPKRSIIEQASKRFYEAVTSSEGSAREAGKTLSAMLLGGAA